MLDLETKIGQLFIVTPAFTMRKDAPGRLLLNLTGTGDRVLFGAVSADDLVLARRLGDAGRAVWVAHGGPVFDANAAGDLPVLLLTYSTGPIAARKAAEAFYGLALPRGQVPVRLALFLLSPSPPRPSLFALRAGPRGIR